MNNLFDEDERLSKFENYKKQGVELKKRFGKTLFISEHLYRFEYNWYPMKATLEETLKEVEQKIKDRETKDKTVYKKEIEKLNLENVIDLTDDFIIVWVDYSSRWNDIGNCELKINFNNANNLFHLKTILIELQENNWNTEGD